MQETNVVCIYPDDHYFGIQFKPYAVAILLDRDISNFNDLLMPLSDINVELSQHLRDIFKAHTKPCNAFDSYFEKFFLDKQLEPSILKAIEQIKNSSGNISINDLSTNIGIHQKKLERLFIAYIGVSPKKFSKIVRFYNTHTTISKYGIDNLSQVALEKGYFDQAHFNRDFKKFTGVNPSSKLMSILYNT